MSKFYEFTQNNSGGYLDLDDKVTHRIFIEAKSEKQALEKFKPMIVSQSPSCPCCGDRWNIDWNEYINLDEINKNAYPVFIYPYYKDPENLWFKKYGYLPRTEEPKWMKQYSLKKFGTNITFETLTQYFQFLANEYGEVHKKGDNEYPDIRVYLLNGGVDEYFHQQIVEDES